MNTCYYLYRKNGKIMNDFLFFFSLRFQNKCEKNVIITDSKQKKENGKFIFFHTHTTLKTMFYTRSEMNIIYVEIVVFRLTVAGDTRVACVMFGVDSVSLRFDVDVVIVVICC